MGGSAVGVCGECVNSNHIAFSHHLDYAMVGLNLHEFSRVTSISPAVWYVPKASAPRCVLVPFRDPCVAVQKVENMSLFFLPHHRPSLTTFSCSLSRPVVGAVIDMPLAINQHSSRAERRPLSERTGLATLEKRVREEEFIQLNS